MYFHLGNCQISNKDKVKTLSLNMSLNTCVHVFNANIAKYLTLDIGCLQMMRLFNGFVSGERRLDMGVTSDFQYPLSLKIQYQKRG